jgi:GDP-mannose 6-dehydrogenase
VPPGTTESLVIPELEKISTKAVGRDFTVCSNPNFMRRGSSLKDFERPPFVIIGSADGQRLAAMDKLYEGTQPIFHTTLRLAEMLKYACNAFHALKITFANEVGNICRALDVDSYELMRLFSMDGKLNNSPAYLKPGLAFGGPYLPKDLRVLLRLSEERRVRVPLLSAVLESNGLQLQRAVDLVLETGKRRVGIVGLAFKRGTSDVRESPMVHLAEALLDRGLEVKVFDANLLLNRLGTHKMIVEEWIPHIRKVLCSSLEELIAEAELIVLGSADGKVNERLASLSGKVELIDLVGFFEPKGSGASPTESEAALLGKQA